MEDQNIMKTIGESKALNTFLRFSMDAFLRDLPESGTPSDMEGFAHGLDLVFCMIDEKHDAMLDMVATKKGAVCHE